MVPMLQQRGCHRMSSNLRKPVPAAAAEAPHFIVGQDSHGWWLAVETHDRGGGLFKSRADALQFVEAETCHRPGACEMATAPLHLKF